MLNRPARRLTHPRALAQPCFPSLGNEDLQQLGETSYAPDAAVNDWLGAAVAIGCDFCLAGAPIDDAPLVQQGSVSVFARDPKVPPFFEWIHLMKIVAPDAAAGDRFGDALSMSGDTAIISAWSGGLGGKAYIFHTASPLNPWIHVSTLIPPDVASGDRFGRSVAISDDIAVVGAPFDDDLGSTSGSAYVFGRDVGGPDNWGLVRKILAPDGINGDQFGFSTAIEGDLAVIGAHLDDDHGGSSGAVYLFSRDAGGANNWGFVKKLVASDAASGDQFGTAVAIADGGIIVGAPLEDEVGNASGAAYVFRRNAGGANNWGFVRKLVDDVNGEADANFGASVAVSRGVAVIGAPFDDGPFGPDGGVALLYVRDHGGMDAWTQTRTIHFGVAFAESRVGVAVAVHNGIIAVGAPLDDREQFLQRGATITEAGSVEIHDGSAAELLWSDCDNNLTADALDLSFGAVADCNDNGRPDQCEIAAGDADDVNLNGVPDECESGNPCPADLNADGAVNSADLSFILGAWGPCP